jgi:hypothetical protein
MHAIIVPFLARDPKLFLLPQFHRHRPFDLGEKDRGRYA